MTCPSDVAYLCHYADKTPDKLAVIAGDEKITYGELWRLVRGFACYLKQQTGLQKGDIVLAKATQTADYVVLYYGGKSQRYGERECRMERQADIKFGYLQHRGKICRRSGRREI